MLLLTNKIGFGGEAPELLQQFLNHRYVSTESP